MRDLVVQAILDYLHVFTNQIDTNEEDRPILASSPTGTALKVLAKQQDLTEGTLLRVGAHMLEHCAQVFQIQQQQALADDQTGAGDYDPAALDDGGLGGDDDSWA